MWQALQDYDAELVLNGHEHNYERFAPQDPNGRADFERGIREFVVGTGGESHYPIIEPIANSEVHNDHTYGVLKLTLKTGRFDWDFLPVVAGAYHDTGSNPCHGRP